MHRWHNTDSQEMTKFIAMLLSMAISERGDLRGIFIHKLN